MYTRLVHGHGLRERAFVYCIWATAGVSSSRFRILHIFPIYLSRYRTYRPPKIYLYQSITLTRALQSHRCASRRVELLSMVRIIA